MKYILVTILLLACVASGAEVNPKFLKVLNQVEASGKSGVIIGDSGKSRGPFQIHKSYWQDAVSFDKTIGGKYEDCSNLKYSQKIVGAYLNRYCSNAVSYNDYEAMARCHNSGPNWKNKTAKTDAYWQKVKKELTR